MLVNASARIGRLDVVADGRGFTGRVGTAAVAGLADRLGLTAGLSRALAGRTRRRSPIDGGRVLRDLVVMLVDGGDAVSDLGALRDQPELFGRVASDATVARVVAAVGPDQLQAIRRARAAARERAWQLGAAPQSVTLDVDASLVTSHSDKEGAAPTCKHGFGFHPMLGFCAETREAFAAILRPGNAGANTAHDKICVVADALGQIPASYWDRATAPDAEEPQRIVVRCDAAGATHELVAACRELGLRFSVGFPIHEPLRQEILALTPWRWRRATGPDGTARGGAWVAELPAGSIPAGWPEGSRLLVRKERPHPGAQLSFSDADGHRFQLVMTDRRGDPRILEREHRARGDAENRIRTAKDCGMRNLPFHTFFSQRSLARARLVRARPDRLDTGPAARRSARHGRAESAALPSAARRRPDHPPRPLPDAAHRSRLALGRRSARRRATAPGAARAVATPGSPNQSWLTTRARCGLPDTRLEPPPGRPLLLSPASRRSAEHPTTPSDAPSPNPQLLAELVEESGLGG